MTRSIRPLYLALSLVACFGLSGCDSPDPSAETDEEGGAPVDFVSDVKPILQTHCISCHNDEHLFGDLNLMSRASAMRGSKSGPVIVPGDPDKSLLYQVTNLEHAKSDKAMPATGPNLDEEEKKILSRWIEQGADWPEGEEGRIVPVKPDADAV